MDFNDRRQLACTTCAKAKSRCIPGPTSQDKCERCHRLNKDCLPRDPAPPRAKTRVQRSRVAELEKRLSELTSQLDNVARPEPDEQQSTPENELRGESQETLTSSHLSELRFNHIFPPLADDGDDSSSWPSNDCIEPMDMDWQSPDSPWPLPAEAQMMLTKYHGIFEHLFPFVPVPRNVTTGALRSRRPILWKALMMVCTYMDATRQRKLGEELLGEITRMAFVDGEKSLDLLQGLLLLVAWFHHALKSTRLTNLLFLARSMCLNLDLGFVSHVSSSEEAVTRDLDGLRAYAGTYYVNTLVFTTNKKLEVLMDTAYLEKCCNILEAAKQQEFDPLVVDLTRAQQLAQSISLTMAQVALEPSQQTMEIPVSMVVQSFQGQLDTLRQSLSPGLKGNAALLSHIAIAGVLLTDFALSDSTCNIPLTDRLRILRSCVLSLRAFFDTRMAITDLRPRFVCLHGSDLTFSILTGLRLVSLRLPGWNPWQISQELAFEAMMDWVMKHLLGITTTRARNKSIVFSAACSPTAETGISKEEDALERFLRMVQGMRSIVGNAMSKARQDSMFLSEDNVLSVVEGFMADVAGGGFLGEFTNNVSWNLEDLTHLELHSV